MFSFIKRPKVNLQMQLEGVTIVIASIAALSVACDIDTDRSEDAAATGIASPGSVIRVDPTSTEIHPSPTPYVAVTREMAVATPTPTPTPTPMPTPTPTPYYQDPTAIPVPVRTVTQPGANVWKINGQLAPTETIISITGPGHCDWESATLLHIGSPLGSVMESGRDVHQYLGDPEGIFAQLTDRLRSTYDPNADLPNDAKFSGYVRNGVELWVSQSQIDEAIYMVDGSRVERWPKAEPIILCA